MTGVLTTAVPTLRHWKGIRQGPMKKNKLLQWGRLSLSLLGAPLAPVPAP